MSEYSQRWAERFVTDKIDRLSGLVAEAMIFDEEEFEQLEEMQRTVHSRLEEIRMNPKIDTYDEFEALCNEVRDEMQSFRERVLRNETRLIALTVSCNALLISMQVFVAGLVCTAIGTGLIRSTWYIAPSTTEMARREAFRRKCEQIQDALSTHSSDLRYRLLALEAFGLSGYQQFLAEGLRHEAA